MLVPILQKWFPHTTPPFISNAPMFGTANAKLAAAVVNAGGFGFIGGGFDFSSSSAQIQALEAELTSARALLNLQANSEAVLPLGVGFITLHPSIETFLDNVGPVLKKHKPAAIWLFAPQPTNPNPHDTIIPGLQRLGSEWGLKVFVQVGTVAAAREAASQGADGIVAQGTDAGGHQWAKGAGIVSVVPEVRDMLKKEFGGRYFAILAAGGIVEGRGVAAALALGADGVTMGTRFVVSDESATPADMKEALLRVKDGASSTIKDPIHDDIQGPNIWPSLYDGRAVIGKSYQEYLSGKPLDEVKSRYKLAIDEKDNSRRTLWAGSGIGMVNEQLPAGDIVKKTQEQARYVFKEMSTRLMSLVQRLD